MITADAIMSFIGYVFVAAGYIVMLIPVVTHLVLFVDAIIADHHETNALREAAAQRDADGRRYGDDGGLR